MKRRKSADKLFERYFIVEKTYFILYYKKIDKRKSQIYWILFMGDTKGILAIIYTYKWHLYMCKIYIIYVMGKKVMCCFVTEIKCKKKKKLVVKTFIHILVADIVI